MKVITFFTWALFSGLAVVNIFLALLLIKSIVVFVTWLLEPEDPSEIIEVMEEWWC